MKSDQPHILVTDILECAAFRTLLEDTYSPTLAGSASAKAVEAKEKGKGEPEETFDPLSWLYDFAASLLPPSNQEKDDAKREISTDFQQVLASITTFGLQELQSSKYPRSVKAAAALAIVKVSPSLSTD